MDEIVSDNDKFDNNNDDDGNNDDDDFKLYPKKRKIKGKKRKIMGRHTFDDLEREYGHPNDRIVMDKEMEAKQEYISKETDAMILKMVQSVWQEVTNTSSLASDSSDSSSVSVGNPAFKKTKLTSFTILRDHELVLNFLNDMTEKRMLALDEKKKTASLSASEEREYTNLVTSGPLLEYMSHFVEMVNDHEAKYGHLQYFTPSSQKLSSCFRSILKPVAGEFCCDAELCDKHLIIIKRVSPECMDMIKSLYKLPVQRLKRAQARENSFNFFEKGRECPRCLENSNVIESADTHALICKNCNITIGMCDEEVDEFENIGNQYKPGYKRSNHSSEISNQIQGIEGTEPPPDVLEAVREGMRMHDFIKAEDITNEFICSCLKNKGFHNWTEHSNLIYYKVTGIQRVQIDSERDAILRKMMSMCHGVFEHCPPEIKRKTNFPSYKFMFRKCAELQGYDDIMKHFTLYKSAEINRQAQEMWEYFCRKLGWEIIPTVCDD